MLEDIYATYSQVKSWFEAQNFQIVTAGSLTLGRMRELNDYAYYIIIFSQFEVFVDDEYIFKRDQDSEIQRLYPEKMAFMEKVDVVFDGNRKIYRFVDAWYELRCEIAHGNLSESLFAELSRKHGREITMDTLHQDMSGLMKFSF